VEKALGLLKQAKQLLIDLKGNSRKRNKELSMTNIVAPSQGMVVHREEYRNTKNKKNHASAISWSGTRR